MTSRSSSTEIVDLGQPGESFLAAPVKAGRNKLT